MSKNIIIYGLVAVLVIGAIWLFVRKGNNQSAAITPLLSASPSPSVSASLSPSPSVSPVGGVKTLSGGLEIQDIVIGTGREIKAGDTVTVNYRGWLESGSQFDSSYDHGQPFSFKLGAGQVIAGWDMGLPGMKVGGKRKLIIPPALAYGSQGVGNGVIPPNATLIFEVELISISN